MGKGKKDNFLIFIISLYVELHSFLLLRSIEFLRLNCMFNCCALIQKTLRPLINKTEKFCYCASMSVFLYSFFGSYLSTTPLTTGRQSKCSLKARCAWGFSSREKIRYQVSFSNLDRVGLFREGGGTGSHFSAAQFSLSFLSRASVT